MPVKVGEAEGAFVATKAVKAASALSFATKRLNEPPSATDPD